MKKLLMIAVIFSIFSISFISVLAEQFDFDARSYILVDSASGRVLYEHNADQEGLYPASTTKIMTAILAIENGSMDQVMTASKSAVYDIGKDGMNIGIMPGEEIPMRNLLDALLISSANETANIIAENICSSRQEFVDMMNKKAQELGAVNTHFVNPCGAHDDEHYTTASDLAKIAVYAMKNEEFRETVQKKEYTIPATNKHESWPTLYSSNLLLREYSSDLFKINGIKTGYTGQAGQNLVASAVNDKGMELISVVMGVMNPDKQQKNSYYYSYKLLEYGFKNFDTQKLIGEGRIVKTVTVDNPADDGNLDLVAVSDFECVLPVDSSKWEIRQREVINPVIEAPVSKGEILGYIEFTNGEELLGKVDLIAARTVELPQSSKTLSAPANTAVSSPIKKAIIAVCIILISFVLLRIVLKKISRKYYFKKYRS